MKKSLVSIVFCMCMFLVGISASLAGAEENVSYEEAFGAAAGFALYDTQVVIGITADGIAKNVYTSEEASLIIKEQISLLAVLNSYVKQLIQSPSTTSSDRQALKDVSACIDKLNETANALKTYIQSPSDRNADNFQVKRKASYNAIADLLGIGKDN